MNKDLTHQEPLLTPIQFIKGVGPRRAAQFESLGIKFVQDVFFFVPRRYEDRSNLLPIDAVKSGEDVTLQGKVISGGWVRPKYGKGFFEVLLQDQTGSITCRWFNANYLREHLRPGMVLVAHGRVVRHKGSLLLMHPEFEEKKEKDLPSLTGIQAVYPSTESLNQRTIRRLVAEAIEHYLPMLLDPLPQGYLQERQLPRLQDAVRMMHLPQSMEEANKGRYRLVYDEFLCAQLMVARRKYQIQSISGIMHKGGGGELREAYAAWLGFELTNAQEKVLREIIDDMKRPKPMNRLLQGDVGSGKTAVAIHALLQALDSGHQAVFMAPTEILAVQHFQQIGAFLTRHGIQATLVTGDMTSKDRRNALSGLASGRIRLAVGTHALIYDKVAFNDLGLAVIDEQHKFGVAQRAVLYEKGQRPDVLVMTATPIPRTLALTVFGDLDVSRIDAFPKGRKPIITRVIGEETLPDAYAFFRKQIGEGRQGYIIFPLVEESEFIEARSAEQMFKELKTHHFPEQRIGLLHGRLKPEDKNQIMLQFKEGKLDLLVSTTVVEVGVDVPNATIMLIGNAERFGLAQLHQLRGRIGRGTHKSYCILQGEIRSKDSWRRLKIMEETRDGFRIAEEDLKIRGMGNILGKEQSGFPTMRVGNPAADTDILTRARKDAFKLVSMDPEASEPVYQNVYQMVDQMEKELGCFIQIG